MTLFPANLWQDLRYASRTLSRSRSFVVMATLMLALGIGANTALFSVVLTVLIRPLPYAESERVVWLSNQNAALGVKGAFLNPADIRGDMNLYPRLFDPRFWTTVHWRE